MEIKKFNFFSDIIKRTAAALDALLLAVLERGLSGRALNRATPAIRA